MASILTNNGAMVALQTMRNINKSMDTTQGQIATGLKVGSAKDNAATWAISKVMESDVAGFKSIKENLALGSSTVNVARNAAETTTKLLTEIKEKVVQAQEENVDRAKIQEDITQLRDQITSVVRSAQFNGLNLVNGTSTNPVNVLASLDRAATGAVTATQISVDTVNLSTDEGTALTLSTAWDPADATVAPNNNTTIPAAVIAGGAAVQRPDAFDPPPADAIVAGDKLSLTISGPDDAEFTVTYVARVGDTQADIGAAFANQLNSLKASDPGGWLSNITFAANDTTGVVTITNPNDSGVTLGLETEVRRGGGELASLATLDVTAGDATSRAALLQDMERMIQGSIDAAASFGSTQKRIEIQDDFVSNLMDSLRAGIGALVDADMEEASARLQALQVQQQLGIQSLSIANQQPQNILSLFR